MATADTEKLAGWLVMWRLQHDTSNGGVVTIPGFVRKQWHALGWVQFDDEPDEDGQLGCALTEKGLAVTDLEGANWGIDPIPEESK